MQLKANPFKYCLKARLHNDSRYAMSANEWRVGLAFCTLYTFTYRTTWCVLPLSLAAASWCRILDKIKCSFGVFGSNKQDKINKLAAEEDNCEDHLMLPNSNNKANNSETIEKAEAEMHIEDSSLQGCHADLFLEPYENNLVIYNSNDPK